MKIIEQYIVRDKQNEIVMLSFTADNKYYKHYGGFCPGDPGSWWEIKEIKPEEFENLLRDV